MTPRAIPGHILRELRHRQPVLTTYGLSLVALTIMALGAQLVDARTIAGVSVWDKPAKFLFSVGIFALSAAWLFGYVRPERRTAPLLRAVVIGILATGSFELVYICWQGGHGLASHFNRSSIFYAIMYALMGLGATLLIATTLPLAWEIARRPASGLRSDYVAAVVIGLVFCFLLGGGTGGYMAAQPGHAVGAAGGHLAIVGWNRLGGDLRVPHFLGIHAEQAIPLLNLLVARLAGWQRWTLLLIGSALYATLTMALLAQAIAGHPFLPL